MTKLQNEIKKYLLKNLGVSVHFQKWTLEKKLPLFIREIYALLEFTLLDTQMILMVARHEEEQTPTNVVKHISLVGEHTSSEIIYVHPYISTHNRKRMVEHKVSFVVPGKQMFLPIMGIDFREHFKKLRTKPLSKFSPSTQALIIYVLHNNLNQAFTPSLLAEKLRYSTMTLSRCFDEIEKSGIAEVNPQGRERILKFQLDKEKLWEKAKPYLNSPVRSRKVISLSQNIKPWHKAGLSALAHFSMLEEPEQAVFAVNEAEWIRLISMKECKVLETSEKDKNTLEIEVWNYDPHLFHENKFVDKLSLWLSLQDKTDERIESALEDLMKGIKW